MRHRQWCRCALSCRFRYGASVSKPKSDRPEDGAFNGPSPMPGSDPEIPLRPIGAVIIALVLVLEALALLAAAAFYIHGLITSTPASFGGAIFMLALLLLLAGWLLAVGHFLFRGYRWTRAAALVWQLFMFVLGFPALTSGYLIYGLALVIPPAVALLLLFDKRVIAYVSKTAQPPAAL